MDLLEIAQLQGRYADAMAHVERLLQIDPSDPVMLLTFVELSRDGAKNGTLVNRVVQVRANDQNETSVDAAISLYRGRALAALGLPDAPIDVSTLANRRRKFRPEGLLHQNRYSRAVLCKQTDQTASAWREFGRIYVENTGFEDVRAN